MAPIIRDACRALDKQLFEGLLKSIDGVLFDADGVLWHNAGAIAGSAETVQALVHNGKKVALCTNNSTLSRVEYIKKCDRLGFLMFNQDNIVTTSAVCADYLKRQNFSGKVYLCGGQGISDELALVGIESVGCGVGAVVVGFDKYFNYVKLCKAAYYLQKSADCKLVATNTDETFPQHDGIRIPGTGSLVRAVETGTGRSALVVGKPNAPMFDYLKGKWHIADPSRILMVGDRCNTDIKWANTFGMRSLCVLSGVTHGKDIDSFANTDCMPEFYAPSLSTLLDWLK